MMARWGLRGRTLLCLSCALPKHHTFSLLVILIPCYCTLYHLDILLIISIYGQM